MGVIIRNMKGTTISTHVRISSPQIADKETIWILEEGVWDDNGVWVDTALWNDGESNWILEEGVWDDNGVWVDTISW